MNNHTQYSLPNIANAVYPRPLYQYGQQNIQQPVGMYPAAGMASNFDDDDSDSDDDPNQKKGKGKGGSSCHQCKSRRNITALTYCTSQLDKKNKKCRKKYCGHCLKKFYKESASAIGEKSGWQCPSCRHICCCAACRRQKDKTDTSPLLNTGGSHTGAPQVQKRKKKREGLEEEDARHAVGLGADYGYYGGSAAPAAIKAEEEDLSSAMAKHGAATYQSVCRTVYSHFPDSEMAQLYLQALQPSLRSQVEEARAHPTRASQVEALAELLRLQLQQSAVANSSISTSQPAPAAYVPSVPVTQKLGYEPFVTSPTVIPRANEIAWGSAGSFMFGLSPMMHHGRSPALGHSLPPLTGGINLTPSAMMTNDKKGKEE